MRPVKKRQTSGVYVEYGHAKPDLVEDIGHYCSYCELANSPKDLDVEHIYPRKHHKTLEKRWANFLLSCGSCNSFKNGHQKGPQKNLKKKYLWPHIDNTFRAFTYNPDGTIDLAVGLTSENKQRAESTLNMFGALISPAIAEDYKAISEAYDGISTRSEVWETVEDCKDDYLNAPSEKKEAKADSIAKRISKIGHFSIWMKVFEGHPEVRSRLIHHAKADPACFHSTTTQPLKKGRL